MIRIILADDHHLVRTGIRSLLEKDPEITVLAEASDGQEAVELTARLLPEVLVMDIAMPRLNGIQALEQLQALNLPTRVVMLSMHADRTLVRRALHVGARGYLLKRSVMEELLLAVRAASRDESYFSPAVSNFIVEDLLAGHGDDEVTSPIDCLTPREHEVLQLIAEGCTNQGMAELLQVSVKTIEKHRANLMAKLDVHDVAGLTRLAIQYKVIFLDT